MPDIDPIRINDPEYYMAEPKRQVTCTVADSSNSEALLGDLLALGIDRSSIRVLHGPDGADILDMSGEQHGLVANLRRLFSTMNDTVGLHMEAGERVLRAGGYALAVPAAELDGARQIAGIMKHHHAENILYFAKRDMWKF